ACMPTSPSGETRRVEQLQLGRLTPEDRVRDELAAGEAEDVAVPGVAARDPDSAVPPKNGADERKHVLSQSEDACPAMRHPHFRADELVQERLERRLDRRRGLLDVGELVHDGDVAEAAEQDPPVGKLLPVVEALARVVRTVVEDAVERLARDHLASG